MACWRESCCKRTARRARSLGEETGPITDVGSLQKVRLGTFRYLFFFLAVATLNQAAITDVEVAGATNVQAVLRYTVSGPQACTVEVSEDASLRPLAHDVNPALFAGADSDTRFTAFFQNNRRSFVVGQRAGDQGKDGAWYSRALQAATVHHYRIRCGSDEVKGRFETANIPVGVTYPHALPQDPETGQTRWPTGNPMDRNERIIDPNYGTLIRRISVPGDVPGISLEKIGFNTSAGQGWDNAGGLFARTEYAINAGAGVVEAGGVTWSADFGAVGGGNHNVSDPIANTTTPELYQTERFGLNSDLLYRLGLVNGEYQVTLKFAEIYHPGPGRRVFHIELNGDRVETDFDIFQAAGGRFAAVDRTYRVQVKNFRLDVRLVRIPGKDNPKVSAIRVAPVRLDGAVRREAVSGKGREWLKVTSPNAMLSPAYVLGQSPQSISARITGMAAGSSDAQRTIEVCLTTDGLNCNGKVRTAVLRRSSSDVEIKAGPGFDTWGASINSQDVASNPNFGLMIRPASPEAGPVTIRNVEMNIQLSEVAGFPDAGNFRTCAPVMSNGGYHCSYPGSGGNGVNYLFWINPQTGDSRWLGKVSGSVDGARVN